MCINEIFMLRCRNVLLKATKTPAGGMCKLRPTLKSRQQHFLLQLAGLEIPNVLLAHLPSSADGESASASSTATGKTVDAASV